MARHFRRKKFCRFTVENVDEIDYKNVSILNSFLPETGELSAFNFTKEFG